jgi:CO/xanthine dehydrogenase FAD-binding subunit
VAQLDAFVAPPAWIAAPLIGQCCRAFLASFKIWNSATVGGNLCIALPAGPIIALACALEATCTVWTPQGKARTLAAREFVKGPQQTALMPGELLRAVTLPVAALKKRTAFRQISLSPLGRSGALVIGTLGADGFTLTITAATPAPVVLHFDAMLSGTALRQEIETAVPRWYDDVHGLPAWRHAMTLHLAGEILADLGGAA